MKAVIFCASLLFTSAFFGQNAQAQTDNQATFEAFIKTVYDAYQSGSDDAMWVFYSDNAGEITPDGRLSSGKEALKSSWKEFMKMVDSRPNFSYKMTSWRLITPDVAILTWDTVADIKIQGQQVGGPTSDMAVLRKVNGNWLIEFDSMTPVVEMPSGN